MSRFGTHRNDRPRRRRALAIGIVAVLALAGCGGGGDGGIGGLGVDPNVDVNPGDGGAFGQNDASGDDGASSGGTGVELGPVTATAEPGHAVVEVEGGPTIELSAARDIGTFSCSLSEDEIRFGVSASDGPSMSLTAADVGMGLNANLTVDSDEDPDKWIQYGGTLEGTLGLDVDTGEVSYEGPVTRQDRGAMADGDLDMPTVNVTVAINCGLEHSTAEFDGEELSFAPFESEAGFSCLSTDREDVDVDFSYQIPGPRRLNVDVRADDGGIIGHVLVESDGNKWRAGISTNEGTDAGLSIDGGTLTYTGTFTRTSESGGSETEVEGTVTVHCPTS